MNKTLQSILNDLYTLDPELEKSEKDLIPLLEKLVASKPNLTLDEQFVVNLRSQILVRADDLMKAENPAQASWFHRFLSPLVGGTVALAALVIGLMVWRGQTGLVAPESAPEAPSLAMKTALPPAITMPAPTPESDAIAENVSQKTSEPKAPENAPMMFQAMPAEGGAETTQPALEPAPMAGLRQMAPVSASDQAENRDAIIKAAFERVQAGELKITATEESGGVRSAKDILAIDLSHLPEAFIEIPSVLPEGIRAFEDQMPTWSDGLPQYYLYFEKEGQWYGPF